MAKTGPIIKICAMKNSKKFIKLKLTFPKEALSAVCRNVNQLLFVFQKIFGRIVIKKKNSPIKFLNILFLK